MIQLNGNYLLRITIGGAELSVDPQTIEELTIIQDMNSYLPELRMVIQDSSGILSHILPYDGSSSTVSILIGRTLDDNKRDQNEITFTAYRRKITGKYGTSSSYDIRGLAAADGLFAKDHSRSFTGSIKKSLGNLAIKELNCSQYEISESLDYEKTLLQPMVSTSEFFNFLGENLEGKNGENSYKIFIKAVEGKLIFVCRTINGMVGAKSKYNFSIGDNKIDGCLQIFDYTIIDNYKYFGVFGSKRQQYTYFDYEKSTFVKAEVDHSDMISLADYFLIDGNDDTDGSIIHSTGRTNDFTSNFRGKASNNIHTRMNGIIKMWALTIGLPNIQPGDTVKVLFVSDPSNIFSYQHSGFWMVERVIHSVTNTHRTRLLLTRNGIDTDKKTTLVKPKNKKRV